MLESKKSSRADGLYWSYCKPSRQLIPLNKLGCQNIRRSTSRSFYLIAIEVINVEKN